MNKKAFTLVELLVAGAVFITALSSFVYVLKFTACCLTRSQKNAVDFYSQRSEMERVHHLAFDRLPSANSVKVKILPLSPEVYLVQAGQLATLRSRY